ncbi:MAG: PxKF domain-containing protein, partial [Chloroflexota bacterium]
WALTLSSGQVSTANDFGNWHYVAVGFHQPVTLDNKIKAGQSVPLKWNLYAGSASLATEIIDPTMGVGHYSIGSAPITCGAVDDPTTLDPSVDAGSSGLRYSYFTTPTATAYGQNIYAWQTQKGWASTCRRVIVSYNGISLLKADFQFTK